ITALDNIRLSGEIGRGIRLPHDLILTNDRERIGKLLSETFELAAGQIETSALRNAAAAIYSLTDYDNLPFQNEIEARDFLNVQLARVLLFLLSLWLVKDNAVNIDLGFIEYPRGPHVTNVTSNFRA